MSLYITRPSYSSICTQAPEGLIRVEGYSLRNGLGAVQICAKVYLTSEVPADAGSPPGDTTCIAATSGLTLNPSWYINNVPIVDRGVLNTVLVWSRFIDSPEWFDSRVTFIPCEESGSEKIAPNQVMPALAAIEVPPPRVMSLTPPGATEHVRLAYDEFCSTPEQSVWTELGASTSRWILKACRYGDKLIGVLSDRAGGNQPSVWITDNFRLNSANELGREGMSHSVAVVQPA